MNSYADYEYYRAEYGGTSIPPEQFKGVALRASAYLDSITFGRIEAPTDEVKCACCAIAEELFSEEQHKGVASEKAGDYAVTYSDSGEKKSGNQALFLVAKTFLGNTGLLFKGEC